MFGDAYSQIATLVLISPYGRVLMPNSKLKRFDETGAGIHALTYFDQRVTMTSGVLGLCTEFSQELVGAFCSHLLEWKFNMTLRAKAVPAFLTQTLLGWTRSIKSVAHLMGVTACSWALAAS